MGVLIDDMLKLSRATRAEMSREDVDLTAIARDIAAELLGLEPARHIEFAIKEGLSANADRRLMKNVLQNLLENAWKFSRGSNPAVIEFGGTHKNGQPCFYVRDNGAGFDMSFAGKLFQPFQRLHSAAEFEGTGVGLVTVKRIVTRHGGRIWAESETGKGATFYFTMKREEQ